MAAMSSWELALSLDESLEFARLSGDYNPLHVDPVVARRTQFGGTVSHGIHVLLAALDRAYRDGLPIAVQPATLSVVFSSPLRTGSPVLISADERDDGRLHLTVLCDGRTAVSATVLLQPRQLRAATLDNREYGPHAPCRTAFPPHTKERSTPLALSEHRLVALFPTLAKKVDRDWLADVIATTRIVGMECPGLDSLYSACRLKRREPQVDRAPTAMHYHVDRTDDRFQMVRLAVSGLTLEGSVETFFRAPPVVQKPLTEVAALVPARMFVEQRALVIGGSRGLGELTAKILSAGGADVTITYARGRSEAEQLCAEATSLGYRLHAQQLALDQGELQRLPQWLKLEPFSHVYYFASPFIGKNAVGRWNHSLFEQFSHFYVRAFATLAESLLDVARAQSQRPRFLYPSSILLTAPESGFNEYCAAKAAGETLCAQLSREQGVKIVRPRLPRMRTDQTSGLRGPEIPEPFPVIFDLLRTWCA